MITTNIDGKVSAHHNSDLSGDVIFTSNDGMDVSIPGTLIRRVVARYIAMKRITAIEDMDDEEILR